MSLYWQMVRLQSSRLLAAMVVIFFLCAPYISNVLVEENRHCLMWRPQDTLFLLGFIVFVAIVCVSARSVICRLRRPLLTRMFDHVFLLALGAGLLANLWFQTRRPVGYHIGQFGMEMRTLWSLMGGLIGYSLARPDLGFVRRGKQLCLILSPVMVLVGARIIMAPNYPGVMEPLPSTAAVGSAVKDAGEADSHPVFLFVLDEWSYERTFHKGVIRADLPHLRRFAENALVFHDAYSCGDDTVISLPRLLLQTDLPVVYAKGRAGFEKDGRFADASEFESIFRSRATRGYRTFMVGFTLPYRQILGEQVDVCRSYRWHPVPSGLADRVRMQVLSAMKYWSDPWSSFIYEQAWLDTQYAHYVRLHEGLKQDVLNIVTRQPGNTFALFHYPLPHGPYLFDGQGGLRQPFASLNDFSDVEGYERNLLALDRFVGEVTAAMTEAGRFDDALIVLTSDHNFRVDPKLHDSPSSCPVRHVPLIVKLPRQREPLSICQQYTMDRMGTLIDSGLASNGDPASVARSLSGASVMTADSGGHADAGEH